MKTLLVFDHQEYLLPPSANVNLLLKALGAARKLRKSYNSDYSQTFYHIDRAPDVSVKMFSDDSVFDPPKRKAISQKASGTFDGTHAHDPSLDSRTNG